MANRWFTAGEPLGWRKKDSAEKRRRTALRARQGDLLKTARALGALANVSQDKETVKKARADALHFYRRYQAGKKTKRRRQDK